MKDALSNIDATNADSVSALNDMVKCRETTNQHILKLYEKMIEDIKMVGIQERGIAMKKWQAVSKLADIGICENASDESMVARSEIVDNIRLILLENK